jgi:hypothetical protein
VVYEEVEVVELLVVLALWPLVRSSVVLALLESVALVVAGLVALGPVLVESPVAERLPADAGAGKFAWLDPTPFGS